MKLRRLGNSDMQITPVGLGTWAIGGSGWQFAWGEQDDKASIEAIHVGLDAGINWIDTAAVYGLGHAEEIVARALATTSHKPYVFTKCGRVWDENRQIGRRLRAESIRAECESSLRRLEVETIDLYQIHWPEPDEEIEEGWETLAKLRDEGKIRWIGVSNFNVDQMKRAAAIEPITSLQPPYSLIRREIEAEILPFAEAAGIGVIAYSPMGSGLLAGKMTRQRIAALPEDDWRRRSPNFQEPLLSRNLELAEKLAAIAARHGRTPGEAAIAWALRRRAVTGAIVGVRNADQVRGITGALEFRLSQDEIAELES